ncbi:AcrR family transcriptional regulator [Nocardioides marinisabuli]|uniref:AcrR family transcriptional regulator n=1 Tax=Nocardioides marinisabuli TaxID=419476 RepID=A0A7Y9EZM6_9ACTN|nr:TetR/AcrR family transcriptional regulator [Nocardioides marinisabuli]NYD56923.1 AcrR family transcriptional regulator [Nocardioides marinisabuli]
MTSLCHNDAPGDPRDAYLDAARECILDVGWRRTTLTEVARRAGVSRMTIYRSWADMPTLLGDLMTREWSGLVASTTAEDTGDRDPVERIVDEVVRTIGALRRNELFVRIVELDPDLVLPYLLHRRGRSQELIVTLLADAVARAQAEGVVRPGPPLAIARSLVLAAHGFVLSAHTMVDDQVGADDLDAELRHLLTRALRP